MTLLKPCFKKLPKEENKIRKKIPQHFQRKKKRKQKTVKIAFYRSLVLAPAKLSCCSCSSQVRHGAPTCSFLVKGQRLTATYHKGPNL